MSRNIFQLRVSLKGIKPPVWRKILVPGDMLLPDLHKVIQTTMGWENAHLHQFVKDGVFYLKKMDNEDFGQMMEDIDYTDVRISDLLKAENDTVLYEYDFGDGWLHEILLERILPENTQLENPVCLAGERNCPPEDCGGAWGYENMLQALRNPRHEEHKHYLEWIGGDFDPEHFDLREINEQLLEPGFGCLDLDDL